MYTFIFTIAILVSINCIIQVLCLGMQILPERTFGAMAASLVVKLFGLACFCFLRVMRQLRMLETINN
jgi:hypothetical protein